MAPYHCSVKVISRGGGRSAAAAAAYRAGLMLTDLKTGITHNYSNRKGVRHIQIRLPKGAPAWAALWPDLWAKVELAERRKDAQLAREVEISLPRELTLDQQVALVERYVDAEFVQLGMVAGIAIHEPDDRNQMKQPHAHIMLTMRNLEPDGFGKKRRDWNDRSLLMRWRKTWEEAANSALEMAEHRERIDCRTLEAQREEWLERAAAATDDVERLRCEARAESFNYLPQPRLDPPVWQSMRAGEDKPEYRAQIEGWHAATASKAAAQERAAEIMALADELEENRDAEDLVVQQDEPRGVEVTAGPSLADAPTLATAPSADAPKPGLLDRFGAFLSDQRAAAQARELERRKNLAQASFPVVLEMYEQLVTRAEKLERTYDADARGPLQDKLNTVVNRLRKLHQVVRTEFLRFDQILSEITAVRWARDRLRQLYRHREEEIRETLDDLLIGRESQLTDARDGPAHAETRAREQEKSSDRGGRSSAGYRGWPSTTPGWSPPEPPPPTHPTLAFSHSFPVASPAPRPQRRGPDTSAQRAEEARKERMRRDAEAKAEAAKARAKAEQERQANIAEEKRAVEVERKPETEPKPRPPSSYSGPSF